MDTFSLEFYTDSEEHLKILERELKNIAGVRVDLVAPRDTSAPVLVGVSIHDTVYEALRGIAQTLYDFLHSEESEQGRKAMNLVTIEGDRVNISEMPAQDIYAIIANAQDGLQ